MGAGAAFGGFFAIHEPTEMGEDNKELFGIFAITLELEWKNKGQPRSRELSFYVYPRQQQ